MGFHNTGYTKNGPIQKNNFHSNFVSATRNLLSLVTIFYSTSLFWPLKKIPLPPLSLKIEPSLFEIQKPINPVPVFLKAAKSNAPIYKYRACILLSFSASLFKKITISQGSSNLNINCFVLRNHIFSTSLNSGKWLLKTPCAYNYRATNGEMDLPKAMNVSFLYRN